MLLKNLKNWTMDHKPINLDLPKSCKINFPCSCCRNWNPLGGFALMLTNVHPLPVSATAEQTCFLDSLWTFGHPWMFIAQHATSQKHSIKRLIGSYLLSLYTSLHWLVRILWIPQGQLNNSQTQRSLRQLEQYYTIRNYQALIWGWVKTYYCHILGNKQA
jgi:hypothetical protein